MKQFHNQTTYIDDDNVNSNIQTYIHNRNDIFSETFDFHVSAKGVTSIATPDDLPDICVHNRTVNVETELDNSTHVTHPNIPNIIGPCDHKYYNFSKTPLQLIHALMQTSML